MCLKQMAVHAVGFSSSVTWWILRVLSSMSLDSHLNVMRQITVEVWQGMLGVLEDVQCKGCVTAARY